MPATPTPTRETRDLAPNLARLRTAQSRADGPQVIEGYGAVYYREGDPATEYRLFPDLIERFMPGAFDVGVREDDVRSFFNHNHNQMLGRSASGTLELSVDTVGLRYVVTPPAELEPRNLLELIDRQDVDGSSIQFLAGGGFAKRGEIVWRTEVIDGQTVDIREIHNCELFEVGPVVWQAYAGTTTGVRASAPELEEIARDRERYRLTRPGKPGPDAVAVRAQSVRAAQDLERWRQ